MLWARGAIERVGWSLAALALVAACSEKGTTVYVVVSAGGAGGADAGGAGTSGQIGTTGGASGASGAGTAGSSAGGGGSCAPGLSECNDACLDLTTTAEHCGACGLACGTAMTCVSGACTCIDGYTPCGGACVDTTSDGANCGECGVICGADLVCSQGSCQAGCAADYTLCGQSCVALESNTQHCGSCDQPCAAGRLCGGGSCGCPGGLMTCQNLCVNTETDSQHCGACGALCTGGRVCEDSSCVCPAGVTLCGDSCVDTSSDLNHCGACDSPCDPLGSCSAGQCQAPPACPGLFCERFDDGVLDADLNSTVWSAPTGTTRNIWSLLTLTDQIVEVRMKGVFLNQEASQWRGGVIVRFTPDDGTSYYSFMMEGDGSLYLGGNPGVISGPGCEGVNPAVDPEVWHTMRLEVTGSNPVRLRTFLDGVLQQDCSTTTAPLRLNGSPGLLLNAPNNTRARFDDFIVYAP